MSDENNDELRATKLIGRENGPRLSHRQMTTSGRRDLLNKAQQSAQLYEQKRRKSCALAALA
jgi:hypothetical protein